MEERRMEGARLLREGKPLQPDIGRQLGVIAALLVCRVARIHY
jgi:hypothetical protein